VSKAQKDNLDTLVVDAGKDGAGIIALVFADENLLSTTDLLRPLSPPSIHRLHRHASLHLNFLPIFHEFLRPTALPSLYARR